MTNRDKKKLLLSDTAVPDLFISDYLTALSLNATRLYLYLLLAENHGKRLNEKQLESRFSITEEDVRSAVTELCLAGLISRTEKGLLKSVDIKAGEIEAYIQTRVQDISDNTHPIPPEDSAREKLTQSIAATFFHGSMSYKWYQTVDVLLYEYRFEPDVVYRLFKLFKDKGWKLGTNGIMDYATKWHDLGICTMAGLSEYEMRQGEIEKVLSHFGERLKIRYDGFDQDVVRVWVEKLQYSFEMIAFALDITRKTSNRSNIITKVDARLMEWFATGIQSLPEATSYEQEKSQAEEREKTKSTDNFRDYSPRRKQNFKEVHYSEDEIQRFESDPDEFVAKYVKGIAEDSNTQEAL